MATLSFGSSHTFSADLAIDAAEIVAYPYVYYGINDKGELVQVAGPKKLVGRNPV